MKSCPQTRVVDNDKFRRNALVFLADLVSAETAGQGRCTVYDPSITPGPTAGSKCLGGVPGQPERDAIYTYLTAVFDLVSWWTAEGRALERARQALRLRNICPFDGEEPFAAIIRCTADPTKVDKRTRSKWSRMLRYALRYKSYSEPLDQFIKHKGGINECADRF
jgi:hypothetical protein